MDAFRDPENGQSPSFDISDDAVLSPTSKKILEQCTVAVTASPEKGFRTLIARPPSSGFDGSSGFHFARPNHPVPSFSTRPQPKPARGAGAIRERISQPNAAEERSTAAPVELVSNQRHVIARVGLTQENVNDRSHSINSLPIEQVRPFETPRTILAIDPRTSSTGGTYVPEPHPRSEIGKEAPARETSLPERAEPPEPVS
ncbi:hypothetical protein PRK78_003619 [Emydomyces testavorans]|uniref:Uncharacterized protein n=1 Tax=Emydomyces testavorans TaxID=2070801 RepID=A0AAF0IIQ2_9EURO|nr:hypothetical protein PRK78_003619 [Emydomyces testavorans]